LKAERGVIKDLETVSDLDKFIDDKLNKTF